jgi:hypothetical protein
MPHIESITLFRIKDVDIKHGGSLIIKKVQFNWTFHPAPEEGLEPPT